MKGWQRENVLMAVTLAANTAYSQWGLWVM